MAYPKLLGFCRDWKNHNRVPVTMWDAKRTKNATLVVDHGLPQRLGFQLVLADIRQIQRFCAVARLNLVYDCYLIDNFHKNLVLGAVHERF